MGANTYIVAPRVMDTTLRSVVKSQRGNTCGLLCNDNVITVRGNISARYFCSRDEDSRSSWYSRQHLSWQKYRKPIFFASPVSIFFAEKSIWHLGFRHSTMCAILRPFILSISHLVSNNWFSSIILRDSKNPRARWGFRFYFLAFHPSSHSP